MEKKSPKLRDGSEWIDHEDCIVGDEVGIQNLINACNIALEKGEYCGDDLDEYVGVKKKENSWFEDPKDSTSTRFGNLILKTILLIIVVLIFIGLSTVIKWVF